MTQLVRFPPLAEAGMNDAQRRIANNIIAGRKSLSGPFNAMLRSPEVADPLQQVGAYLRFASPIPQRLKELGIIMVARFWSAEFEWYAHRLLAVEAGLDPCKADAILQGHRPPQLEDDEADIYRFVAELLRTGRLTDHAFDRIKNRFGEQGVTDLIAIVGYYCAVSFFLNADRHPVPEGVEPMPALSGPPFADIG